MACPSLQTGERFLATALAHVDCQAQAIGAYGYGALADPASATSLVLTALLTIFVALFGLRLLLGYTVAGRDVVGDVLKIGIVLTLATSWPAWRVLGYDLVIDGPGEIARIIGLAAGLPGSAGDLAARLQLIDDGLVALNLVGSGRIGTAQGDWFQLGLARIVWLAGTLGPLALVRLSAGILLALAPLMAGLLLFGWTRPLFEGWVRALVATFVASLALALLMGAEIALIEPWLRDVLQRRTFDQQALGAPVEVLVVALAFAAAGFGAVALATRIAFHPARARVEVAAAGHGHRRAGPGHGPMSPECVAAPYAASRAAGVSHAVSENMRREERLFAGSAGDRRLPAAGEAAPAARARELARRGDEPLGASWRRSSLRVSAAGQMRDGTP